MHARVTTCCGKRTAKGRIRTVDEQSTAEALRDRPLRQAACSRVPLVNVVLQQITAGTMCCDAIQLRPIVPSADAGVDRDRLPVYHRPQV